MISNDQALSRMYKALKYPVTAAPEWMSQCFQMARAGNYLQKLPPGTVVTKTKEGDLYAVEMPSENGYKARVLDKRFNFAALRYLQELGILPRK